MKIIVILFLIATQNLFAMESMDFPLYVFFRDKDLTFNSKYNFYLKNQRLYFSKRDHNKNLAVGKWTQVSIPKGVTPKKIEADSDILILTAKNGQIYKANNAFDDNFKSPNFSKKWGYILGRWPPGMKIAPKYKKWALSSVNPKEDKFYTDDLKNYHGVAKGITHIFLLGEQGQEIIFLDPWLPPDYSYRICSPLHGKMSSTAISSSASTIFLINKYGDMFYRIYDFDIGGSNDKQFKSTFIPHKAKGKVSWKEIKGSWTARNSTRYISKIGWTAIPKIKNAKITDRITVIRKGPGMVSRVFRVEGRRGGKTGYFEIVHVNKTPFRKWKFVETGHKIRGSILDNKSFDNSKNSLGPKNFALNFMGSYKGFNFKAKNFNPFCQKNTLEITDKKQNSFSLDIYTYELLRILKKNNVLLSNGAIQNRKGIVQIPEKTYQNLKQGNSSSSLIDFFKNDLKTNKYSKIKLSASKNRLIIKFKNKFKLRLKR